MLSWSSVRYCRSRTLSQEVWRPRMFADAELASADSVYPLVRVHNALIVAGVWVGGTTVMNPSRNPFDVCISFACHYPPLPAWASSTPSGAGPGPPCHDPPSSLLGHNNSGAVPGPPFHAPPLPAWATPTPGPNLTRRERAAISAARSTSLMVKQPPKVEEADTYEGARWGQQRRRR